MMPRPHEMTEDEIDAKIETWHQAREENSLHEYFGWSGDDHVNWAQAGRPDSVVRINGLLLSRRVKRHLLSPQSLMIGITVLSISPATVTPRIARSAAGSSDSSSPCSGNSR